MGRLYKCYLYGTYFVCEHCNSHLAKPEEIVSKAFHGRHGKAYLFNRCVNVHCGKTEERVLITGLHSVADVLCNDCQSVLGWKYEEAFEESEKYKVGKFILEKAKILAVEEPNDPMSDGEDSVPVSSSSSSRPYRYTAMAI
eukprot:TRINITY_DN3299_c0_g1_i3.p1 TRINITY_DN3299_c0_g1~~TRINITY_DN3299_c0_g1_i3.p1  ORF type:complete len:141 (+),score=22.28 TRINITY_DN3299_c0_g1_i3:379-801(+)